MLSAFRASMSFFPISRKVPPSAMMRQDSSNSSPVSEFRMMSTPSPLVRSRIWEEKEVVREEKMWEGGMEKVEVRNSRLVGVPTVAKI
jgi:hypothetical protein